MTTARRRAAPAWLLLLVAAAGTLALEAAPPRAEEILVRSAAYVADFIQRFSGVVAEERFVQDGRRISARPAQSAKGKGNPRDLVAPGITIHRELVSDYLLVKVPGLAAWLSFRDVFEVDGRPVRDRSERMTQLFLQPSTASAQRASEIDREGVRYNLGDPVRTLNSPLLALGFLQASYQSRFKFSLRELDPEAGPDVWIVDYKEQTRPTILRRIPDGDLAARGRFWIEGGTGRVVRTELKVSDEDEVTTTFQFDDRFHIALPVEMREHYWNGSEYVEGVARYTGFRQFAVLTEEKLKQDP